jgi:(2R)-3-sulfolactate dehydrogenase (NADP+)
VAEAATQDEGARLPGQGKRPADPVEVPDGVWQQVLDLAG